MDSDFPIWIDSFDEAAKADRLLGRLISSRLHMYTHQQVLQLSPDVRMTIALGISAMHNKRSLLVETTTLSPNLGRWIAAGILLADWTDRHEHLRSPLNGDILFISQQVGRAKADLENLMFGSHAGNAASIVDIWDIRGIKDLKQRKAEHYPTLYLSNPGSQKEIQELADIQVVVIDGSHPRTVQLISQLLRIDPICKSSTCIIVSSPFAISKNNLSTNFLRWVWVPETVNVTNRRYNRSYSTKPSSKVQEKRQYLVYQDQELDSRLLTIRTLLAKALERGANYIPSELLTAWWLYHRLSQLVVPLIEYEELARRHPLASPLRYRLDALKAARPAEHTKGELGTYLAVAWPQIVEEFGRAYDLLLERKEPAKFWGAAIAIQRHLEQLPEQDLGVICPTELEAHLLQERLRYVVNELSTHTQLGRIRFLSLNQESQLDHNIAGLAHVLVCGPRSSQWRFLDVCRYLTISVLVYSHEVSIDTARVEEVYRSVANATTTTERMAILTALGFAASRNATNAKRVDVKELRPPVFTTELLGEDNSPDVQRADNEMLDLTQLIHSEEWLSSWSEESGPLDDILTETGPNIHQFSTPSLGRSATLVVCETGEQYVCLNSRLLDVFRPVNSKLVRLYPDELKPGDLLLTFDDNHLDNLHGRIVEILEREQIPSKMLLEIWDQTKRQALERFNGDFERLYQLLEKSGISVQRQAVANWISGKNIGPQKPEDFRLVALASRNEWASENIRQICHVVGKVRGFRRLVGRQLGHFLRSAVTTENLDSEFDTFGIAVDDLLAAISVKHVAMIKSVGN